DNNRTGYSRALDLWQHAHDWLALDAFFNRPAVVPIGFSRAMRYRNLCPLGGAKGDRQNLIMPALIGIDALSTSWPGLSRPPTSCLLRLGKERRGCPRHKRVHARLRCAMHAYDDRESCAWYNAAKPRAMRGALRF